MNYKDIIADFYDSVNYLYTLAYTNTIFAKIREKYFILSPVVDSYTPTYPQLYTLVYTNYKTTACNYWQL